MLRLRLPDQPGYLGHIASSLGELDVDINMFKIVEKQPHYVIDDFYLDLPAGLLPDSVVSAVCEIPQVRVEWLSFVASSPDLQTDADVIQLMLSNPGRRGETLIASINNLFHTQWAALVDTEKLSVISSSKDSPKLSTDQIEALQPFDKPHKFSSRHWLPDWGENMLAVSPAAGDRILVISRGAGPDFLDSELRRLTHLATFI